MFLCQTVQGDEKTVFEFFGWENEKERGRKGQTKVKVTGTVLVSDGKEERG